MDLSIKQKDLRAVSLAMADKKELRYYLQGVYVETNGEETRLVATNGHRLHAAIDELNGLIHDPVSFIIPADMVKRCLAVKALKHDNCPTIHLSYDPANGKIEARLVDGSSILCQALDGRFPDYTRIIPRDIPETPVAAVFNPEYVADAVKGYSYFMEYSGKTPPTLGLRPNGNSCGFLSANGFTAVVMPMRGELSPNPDVRLTMPLRSPVKLEAVA